MKVEVARRPQDPPDNLHWRDVDVGAFPVPLGNDRVDAVKLDFAVGSSVVHRNSMHIMILDRKLLSDRSYRRFPTLSSARRWSERGRSG